MTDLFGLAREAVAACADPGANPTEYEFARAVVTVAQAAGVRISVAESLTGGMVAELITSVAGASGVFAGGVVAYSDEAKRAVLGIDHAVLAKYSAISAECALAMSTAAAELFVTDFAISTTGVAGPDPVGKAPVGEVHIAAVDRSTGSSRTKSLTLGGTRDDIRVQTCLAVFGLLLDLLVPLLPVDETDKN